jgi:ADP-ribose pyrophosphatase YjhB (NUDIX family)
MSYITNEEIAEVERKFGEPVHLATTIDMTPLEIKRVRDSQHGGRAHDITVFIFKGNKLLFNAKHFYPEGLYRAPSGAAKPGEGIEAGALREAYEETGAKIELERFLAIIKVKFVNTLVSDDYIDWTSYVFKARYVLGDIEPIDKHEIREARLVDFDEVSRFNEIMQKVNIGGFRYRVFLTKHIMKLLEQDIITANEMQSQ